MIDHASFAALWRELGAPGDPARLHRKLVACWSEKHRHYHTLQHLRECFEHLDGARALAQRPAEIALAIWFHDAFYDPRRDDNERRSAEWARECALELGLAREVADRVHVMVMATADHLPQADPDTQLMVDIDLSIFGTDTVRFDESDGQVRREYAHVPEDDWRTGRRRMLRGFLDRPRLYGTHRFHDMFEKRARENVQRALARLGD